jgi:hypothetical protein
LNPWETIPRTVGLTRSRPLAFRSSSLPSPPIRHYSGAAYDHPDTVPPLSVTRGHRMPANDVGSATRLPIIDFSPAPKTTEQLQPSFVCGVSDTDGYPWGTLTASERKFSRADICSSALIIHASPPQTKISFFGPPSHAIRPEQAGMDWNCSSLQNVSPPASISASPPSQFMLPPLRRKFRSSVLPCTRFTRNSRRWVGIACCSRM